MAYIGQSIKNGTFKDLGFTGTFNSSTTDFNLGTQIGSAAQILVSKNGVIQRPGTDFTLASGGSQISFTTAPASADSIFIVEISGAVGGPMNRDINGDELILDVDGDTSITADTDDQIDIKIAGADDFKFSANAMNVLSGSTLTIDSGATITNSGTANGFGLSNWSESSGNLLAGNASYGIYLGVNSATAANLLNDYEEGTFTPTVGGASSDPTVSFNSRSGNYTKIGDRVFINVIVYLSAISGGGGNINIRGLPFTSNNRGTGSMIFDRMRIQASYQNEVTPYVENNSTYVAIGEMNDAIDEGRTHVQIDDLASNAYIMFSAQYTTDS